VIGFQFATYTGIYYLLPTLLMRTASQSSLVIRFLMMHAQSHRNFTCTTALNLMIIIIDYT